MPLDDDRISPQEAPPLEQLFCGVVEAFQLNEMRRFIKFKMHQNLDNVVEPGPKKDVYFNLIERYEAHGRLNEFVVKIHAERPHKTEFRKMLEKNFPEAFQDVPPQNPIQAFTTLPNSPNNLDYRIISAYKDLHDSLHQIQQKLYQQIRDAADSFDDQIMQGYTHDLGECARTARAAHHTLILSGQDRQETEIIVNNLEAQSVALNAACTEPNQPSAKEVAKELEILIKTAPSLINHKIQTLADRIRNDISEASPSAINLFKQHAVFQDVENNLWLVELDDQAKINEWIQELSLVFPHIERSISRISNYPYTDWGNRDETVLARTTHFSKLVKNKENDGQTISKNFREYRKFIKDHFFLVDTTLKNLCRDLPMLSNSGSNMTYVNKEKMP